MRQVPFHKASAGTRDDDTAASAAGVKRPFDPWRVVRRGLAGRYRFACWMGVWTAFIGAFLGWYFSAPVYRSEGLVRIASVLPQVMEETDQNRPMAMFDAYLQAQQMLLSSRGLLEMAVQDDAWKALGRRPSPDEIQMLANNLKVEFKPRTDYLRVFYTDADPSLAAAAVRALINSYEKVYAAQQGDQRGQRLKALEERRQTLAARVERLEGELRKRVDELGASDVEPLQYGVAQRVMKIESSLIEVRRALAAAPKAPAAGDKSAAPGRQPAGELTVEQLALTDPSLRAQLEAQGRRDDEVARLQAVYGERHPQLVKAKFDAERGQKRVDDYIRFARVLRTGPSMQSAASAKDAATAVKTPEVLRAEEAVLVAQLASLKKEMVAMGGDRFRMDRLRADEESARKDLAEVTRRMQVVDAEEALGGRLSVISRGDVPLAPMLNRHLRDATAGMVGGFMLPGALLVLGSMVRPRYRNCLQAAGDLAGLVPTFTAVPKMDDPAALTTARATARCVHQMRVRLNSGARERKTSVYLVTSAGAGEGKTNLALSLGASFAASGFRTLIIDGDLAGRGLTLGLGVEALPGLREAAENGTLRDHVRGTRDGLCILPTGADDELNAYAVPQTAIERLVDEARSTFQVILIDTGAVFGSIEASVLAPRADGVLFVVARGQREALVEQSIQHLTSLGAKLAAVVFNGAERADFERAMRAGAPRQFFNRPQAAETPADAPTIITGFGPVLDSVLSSLPLKQATDFQQLYENPATLPPSISKITKAA
jgi:Mrp family chromosome partitioning ATPase/uncharacterized protein involved in exopolysaccharide biosynthesis